MPYLSNKRGDVHTGFCLISLGNGGTEPANYESKGNASEAISDVLDKAKSTLRATVNMDAEEDYTKQMQRTAGMWSKDKSGTR